VGPWPVISTGSFNMVNIWLTFNFAGIEGYLIILEDFDKTSSLACVVRISTEQGWKHDRVEIKQSRQKRHDFKLEDGFLSGNVGQAVVQDGRSADHGIRGSSVSYLSINKCFQAENGSQIIYRIRQHSNYRRLGKRVIQNVCKLICRPPLF